MGDIREVVQVVQAGHHLSSLVTIQVVTLPAVVLMTNQSVNRVYAELVAPVQLLLESPVLIAIVLALTTTLVTLTITNHS